MKANSVLETIGRTPHIRLSRLFPDAEVWVKSERSNPGGSIKDRIGVAMIEAAEKSGDLKPGGTIIEPTSGNTGVGLAMAAAVKGYKLILVMPESMSVERRRLMQAYGATFELTPREGGMKAAIAKAEEMRAATPGAWIPQQFENPANIDVHMRTTVPEILEDFPNGIDAIITGVGTGGHITACAEGLKPKMPGLQVFAVEPALSPVISGGKPAPHPIQGIGAGFIPGNLHQSALDGVIQVDAEDAREMARQCAAKEGLLVGISSGATLAAIKKKLPDLKPGAVILGFNYDTGERYLSVPDFLRSNKDHTMSTLSLPAAASHLGVPVRVLRRAIRMGTVPTPANLNALSLLSQEWFASVQLAVAANPKALKVFPQKVPAFARYEGTSCFRKYPNRVREFNAHKAKIAS